MVLVAFERARCDVQLGPSESFVDWSGSRPSNEPASPRAVPAADDDAVMLREMWTSTIQVLALALMLVVSVGVGAALGATSSMGGPDAARSHVVAQALEMRQPLTVEQVAAMEAEVDRTLANVQSDLGPLSPVNVW